MATDLFDQLATGEVPPPPPQFEQRVHHRLNHNLLVHQLVDFAVGAMPCLAMQLISAAWGLVHFTILGRYPRPRDGNQQ